MGGRPRAGLEESWLRRVMSPRESLRALMPRVVSPRLGWRLASVLARLRGGKAAPSAEETKLVVAQWQDSLRGQRGPRCRPAVVGLGCTPGDAIEPLLPDLAQSGWMTFDLGSESCPEALTTRLGFEAGLAAAEGLRSREQIRAAVTLCTKPEWLGLAERIQGDFGWRRVESTRDVGTFERAVAATFPKVSVLIVTHNNLHVTRLCLDSIRAWTAYPNFEVIVVDNGSNDDTVKILAELASLDASMQTISNTENRGFAAACNQAASAASGDVLCFLNNDTVVTPGWLWVLVRALEENPGLGMVGPVSNAVANEARVKTGYSSLESMLEWAESYTWKHDGRWFRLPMLALFCAVLTRETWERVGPLDESFGIGLFEDDDFCRRLRHAGYELGCRRDSFVHHWQQASFKLLETREYRALYERNRAYFRSKWR